MFGMFHSAGTVTLVVIIVIVSGSDARLYAQRKPNYYCRPKVCECHCRSTIQSFPNGDKITSEIKTAIAAEAKTTTDTLNMLKPAITSEIKNASTPAIIAAIQKATGAIKRDILAAIKSPHHRPKPRRRPKGNDKGEGKGKGKGKGKVQTCTGRYVDCSTLYKRGIRRSGVYKIKPFAYGARAKQVVSAYCDMKTDGGGWTVFQRRFNGHINFYRNWAAYAAGFGNAKGEYWLGNDILHALTTHYSSELRVDLESWGGKKKYAKYSIFVVEGSKYRYTLHAMRYSGTAGDSLAYHNGRRFSTYDRESYTHKCANKLHGAWWYLNCHYSNLNGRYYYSALNKEDAISWYHYSNKHESLKRTAMKVRPSNFKLG